jgi:predicted nuclease with TOPRIM domain
MPTEEELEARLEELAGQISTQGGKVKGLKDEVKGLKKNKVRCFHPFNDSTFRALERSLLVAHPSSSPLNMHDKVTLSAKYACMQEDTTEADKKVAEAVDELKRLKAAQGEVEAELEKVTGIPRNKEAFREAVVRTCNQLYI